MQAWRGAVIIPVCTLISPAVQMNVNSDALAQRLARSLESVYLVSGDDPLLVAETTDLIRKKASQCGFTGRDVHIAERGFDWSQIQIEASNLSLFDDKRLTEIRLPTGKPGKPGSAALVELAKHAGADDCFLVIVPKLDKAGKNSAWVKKLSAAGVMVQVWPVSMQQLPGWIAARLKKAGLSASGDAIAMLADRSQGNLLAAQQEITKLSLHFEAGTISAEDVAKSVADSARFDVFQLVDAALVGDARRSLRVLSGLQAEGVEPTLILWALTREIRSLASIVHQVSTGASLDGALAQARVWSTRKAMVSRAARRFTSTANLAGLLVQAAHTDAAVKGQSNGDTWSGLRALLVGLSQSGPVVAGA